MKKLFSLMVCALMLFSCSEEYDDSGLRNDLNDLENRVEKLEELCKQMNTNISSLQTLVTALQKQVTITKVEQTTDGYVIRFSDGQTATITNGKAPVISVKQDGGIYYWTLNGEWLTDDQDNRIKAQGIDGTNGKSAYDLAVEKGYSGTLDEWLASLKGSTGNDGNDGKSAYELAVEKGYTGSLDEWLESLKGVNGITPKLKIENGRWLLSLNGGETWEDIGQATGEDGDSFFKKVTEDNDQNVVYFTLSDDTVIAIPKGDNSRFAISFETTDIAILNGGETKTISYTVTEATESTTVKAIAQDGWKVKVEPTSVSAGTITITAPDPIVESEILVFANDGSYRTVMVALNCAQGEITVADNAFDTDSKGGLQEVKLTTNLAYTVEIPDEAQSWLSVVETRAVRQETIVFSVAANEGLERFATVSLKDENGNVLQAIIFRQLSTCTKVRVETVGGLEAALAAYDYANIESLKIAGVLNDVDFLFIYRMMPKLKELDISEVNITELPVQAFYNSKNVENLILPNTLTTIGEEMFYQSRLKTVEIPASVETIGSYAFKGCSSLTTVTFEKGSQLKTIGEEYDGGAFSGCSALTSIEIPASVETIGSSAFKGCSSLTTVTFEEGSQLKTIGGSAFESLRITHIEIPASVETIGSSAFKGCSALTSIEIPASVETIGSSAFKGCSALTSIEIPASVETIGSSAFKGCSSLTTVTFEEGSQLKTIGGGYSYEGYHGAFSDCPITSIEIPASVETIGSAAFAGCSSLTTVTFEKGSQLKTIGRQDGRAFLDCPKLMTVNASACTSVDEIGRYAFYNCRELRLFLIGTAVPPICRDDAFTGINPYSVLKVPSGCADTYKRASEWNNFASITGLDE